jgi:dihydrofolate synthase/folylpolyglutamate synthase
MSCALDWLFSLEQFGIKLGLDNIRTLLDELGRPERAFGSIHVAGTNGKGSVVAMVDACLRAAGWRSARYTSPHLVDLAERFVIDGRPVEHTALVAQAERLRSTVGHLLGAGQLSAPPTFFEATTAMAFALFRDAQIEVAVCEVGLGGRLDATNVLEPLVTAITTIGLDHQQHLGDTISAIAAEKAGIIKPGVPVVIGPLDPTARQVVETKALAAGAPVVEADLQALGRYGPPRLALAGAHQLDNAAVAVAILEELSRQNVAVPARAVTAGLEHVVWPGRLEVRRLDDRREVLLDAAHNPDGARTLRRFLEAAAPRPLVFAAMRDKDAEGMIRTLAPVVSVFVMTRASHQRSTDPILLAEAAARAAPDLPVLVEPSIEQALQAAWRLSHAIVVAGSLFLLGDVMKVLERS